MIFESGGEFPLLSVTKLQRKEVVLVTEVERVKEICKSQKISIKRLEEDCGFSNGYIRRLKRGVFPSDRLFVIAEYLHTSVEELSETARELNKRKKGEGLEEVSVRLVRDRTLYADTRIDMPEKAVELLGDMMCCFDREVVAVINLQTDGRPINFNISSIGAINYALVSPREILKSSILSNAANIILLHNHPSGRIMPSREDIMMTDRMIQVCSLVEIPLMDHIIIGSSPADGFFSMRKQKVEMFQARSHFAKEIKDLQFPSLGSENENKRPGSVAESEADRDREAEKRCR